MLPRTLDALNRFLAFAHDHDIAYCFESIDIWGISIQIDGLVFQMDSMGLLRCPPEIFRHPRYPISLDELADILFERWFPDQVVHKLKTRTHLKQ